MHQMNYVRQMMIYTSGVDKFPIPMVTGLK